MYRCNESAGRYLARADYLLGNYGEVATDEYLLDVQAHAPVVATDGRLIEDIPYISNLSGYEGELCVHEIDWLSRLPGQTYSKRRRHYLERLD